MDRRQTQFRVQEHGRKLRDYAYQRPAQWAQVVNDPMVPRDGLPALRKQFAQESMAGYAAALAPIATAAQEVRAAIPPKPVYRPRDAADAARVNGEVAELLHRSPEGIVVRLEQAREEGDTAYIVRALPLVAERMQFSKPMIGHAGLSNAVVDAQMYLANLPEVVARAEAIQFADELDSDVATLAKILMSDNPAERIEIQEMCGALPHVLPKPEPSR